MHTPKNATAASSAIFSKMLSVKTSREYTEQQVKKTPSPNKIHKVTLPKARDDLLAEGVKDPLSCRVRREHSLGQAVEIPHRKSPNPCARASNDCGSRWNWQGMEKSGRYPGLDPGSICQAGHGSRLALRLAGMTAKSAG
ncbi:MAG TPA: hypothetical protein VLL76_09235 [Candidatus Omnitrophota bacterium]|nr:hypothetical protein [Candidatus Omnitrophota bacterium]